MIRMSLVVVMVLGAGCMNGGIDEPESAATGALVGTGGSGNCQEWLCGTNSPQIAELGFWELNLPATPGVAGAPNNAGLQVLGFVKDSNLYLPTVVGGRLTASRRSVLSPHETITLSGAELAGGWFSLRRSDRQFRIRISEVGSVDSWAQPVVGARVVLESYLLDWSELVGDGWTEARNIRGGSPSTASDALTMVGQNQLHTLLFEGDRIDATRKLDTGVDTSWINLGVAGSALAKLALTGHTEAARNAGTFVTTLAERQAMLKMLVADYCGDGTPFTVAGQPLDWRDDRGTMALSALVADPPQPLVLEARWAATGAVCLDRPRLDAHWTALGEQTFGADVYDQVMRHCPAQMPPPCSDSSFELDGFHLLTAIVPLSRP
jgi:hypothetical protein